MLLQLFQSLFTCNRKRIWVFQFNMYRRHIKNSLISGSVIIFVNATFEKHTFKIVSAVLNQVFSINYC